MLDKPCLRWPPQLQTLNARTEALNFNMASEQHTGALLQVLAASKPGGNLLELGTGTGIGTSWLLSGMDEIAALTSVETDEHLQSVAREVLGSDPRLNLILEDGGGFICRQPENTFDLIFADAMPGKFEVLEETLRLVKAGGFYVIDDLLPQPNWPEGHGSKVEVLLDRLRADTRFSMVPLTWSTGVAVLVRGPRHTE
jgi:predicted O-methyltransferase YrrM